MSSKNSSDLEKGNSEIENESILLEENDDYDLHSRTEDDMKVIQEARQQLVEEYEEAGVLYFSEADKYMRSKNNYDISTREITNGQNTTLSFFNRRAINNFTIDNHPEEVLKKWFNKMDVKKLSIWDKLCFYTTSVYNNQINKFKFVEYMGEITMMYENFNKSVPEMKQMAKKIVEDSESKKDKGPLYFIHEEEDDIIKIFSRIDVFLRNHIEFMLLCSGPVDLFLNEYFAARSNCCGLIENIYSIEKSCFSRGEYKLNTVFLDFKDCREKDLKHGFLLEMEGSYLKGADRIYSTNKRIAALHNIIGRLHAISEFIKTTVEMNDQLLFRLLMLVGSFLTVLGEFVWNTHIKDYYYR